MSLKQEIQNDMKEALKSGNKETVSVLRLLLSALKNAEISKREELTSGETLEIAAKEMKKWEEAAQEYEKAGMTERADKERRDAAVIKKYLPQPLSDEELLELIEKVVSETGAVGPSDLGKVMREIMPKVKGRADGAKVNALVREVLTGK